ncbi:hypothetical protein [Candidatus Uabimicrobium sp. HlEnr_7]|uniref:hypothetical protein n=1 Tax=Candidatus Uabimicrobium helgolandensis TaxID=3095367 RepID=UPI003556A193
MTNSGNISEILFQVNHASLKGALKSLWAEHSTKMRLDKSFEEVKFFSKTLENFIRSPLGGDVLTLLRITGYQIVLATQKVDDKEKLWAITGKGPAVIYAAAGNVQEEVFYIRYPFEFIEFIEQVLAISQLNPSDIMETIVGSTNKIISTIH